MPGCREPDLVVSSQKKTRSEILYDGYMYDISNWIQRHPGGKIIEYYTGKGENATIPIQQFHQRSIKRTMAIMASLPKRKATLEDVGLSPSTLAKHKELDKDFQELEKELRSGGFFQPSLTHTLYRALELVFLFLFGTHFLGLPSPLSRTVGILLIAMFSGRCGWWMHEGGHHSITGAPVIDKLLQSFVYGFGDGMSAAWWSSQHNRHHAMPQRIGHDVDLNTLPLLAFNKMIVKKGKMGFFIQNQSKLFILIDTFLVAMFWKLYLHPRHAWKKGAYSDLVFMGIHYWATLGHGIPTYSIIVWLTSVYIFMNFALSHTHCPVTTEPRHWVEYSLLHTVDVEPSALCDWWMCYLNYQVEHHLFPTMPQFRLPKVRPKIMELAKKHGIRYGTMSYWEAVQRTFQNLENVSKELKEI